MKDKKLHFKIKKKLLFLIIIEILAIIYLLNMVLSSQLVKFKPIFVDVPMNVIYENDTNSSLKYFSTEEPNEYFIKTQDMFFGTVIYSTNSDGLRERYNYSRIKPSNVFRIAIFGDSFTYGLYLNISDVFTEILEDRLNSLNCSKKIEVLNFGVGGYDIPYMVELFREKGKYYNSDINLFVVKDDDIEYLNEIWTLIKYKYMKQAGYPSPYKDNASYRKWTEAAEKAADEYFSIINSTFLSEQAKKSFNILYNENAGKSKIFIFTFQIDPLFYNEFLRNASKDYGFTFLSLNDIGNNYNDLWERKLSAIPIEDTHPNKLGHQFLADILYVYFVSNNLIEC